MIIQQPELVLFQVAHKLSALIHNGENHVYFVRPHVDRWELLVSIGRLLFRSRRRRRGSRLLRESYAANQYSRKKQRYFEGHKSFGCKTLLYAMTWNFIL